MKRRHLPLFGRLDRYVTSHFIASYSTALFLLLGLFLIMDLTSNLDDFLEVDAQGHKAPAGVLIRYYLLKLPFLFLEVAPFITLMAGMFTVNRLLKKNEVTPVLSSGVSVHRMLVPVFLCGCVLAVSMFALREIVVSNIADKRDALQFQLKHPSEERVLEAVAVHELSGNTVFLERFYPDSNPPRVEELSAALLDGDRTISIQAEAAYWDPEAKVLRLQNGHRSVVGSKEVVREDLDVLEGFAFTPQLAKTYYRARNPMDLSFSEVQELMSREPEDSAFNTLWHYLLTFPLANLVLLLVGLPVLFQYERGKGAERMALGGIFCIFYFAVDFVFRSLGLGGGLSPILAGWIPILIAGSLGIALTDGIRT
ncbi:MAG: LptF/LptG family permease [Planctomycetes bacterium]|nr:LptF/LptG family permease [Planctomycetota bacterium]MCB9910720.1 LptF/LptG family permease [Planctomycetota bacterium]MCB9912746.1 LptF/LptG family permease [Planctomycetota bacterium]HPF14649.1 LptF/LptG family permease [Planctomycetota bacterium]HRV80706.1 LptF/LptG family permease [Planctomycetota bacterium]